MVKFSHKYLNFPMPKFKPYNQNQQFLLPLNLKECLPKDHLCFVIDDVVEQLDLSEIEKNYDNFGSPGYNPKMFIKVLIYSYAKGVRSSRKIEESVYENAACKFLAANQTFDHSTINLFRKNNLRNLEDIFAQIIIYCNGLGMINLKELSLDGSIIKANASKKNTFNLREIKKLKKKIRSILEEAEEIDKREDKMFGNKRGYGQMPEKLIDPEVRKKEIQKMKKKLEKLKKAEKSIKKKQKKARTKDEKRLKRNSTQNTTDSEANLMKLKGGRTYRPAYNVQLATNNQVILGYGIFGTNSDFGLLEEMIERTKRLIKGKIEFLKADAGYFSKLNIRYLKGEKINGYIPDTHIKIDEKKVKSRFSGNNFKYDKKRNRCICPLGKFLMFKENKVNGAKRYVGKDCESCKERSSCTKGKRRNLRIDLELKSYREEMREKLNTKEGKAKYLERMHDVEPVFGNLKYNQKVDQFLCRGKEMVETEFGLSCLGHNMIKINNWLKKKQKKVKKGFNLNQLNLIY